MKKILYFLLLVCSMVAQAQDVIVRKDGNTIVCRVLEVSSSDVTYKKWNALDGSNYVTSITEISYITYENGEKKVFTASAFQENIPVTSLQTQSNDVELLKMASLSPERIKKMRKNALYIGVPMILAGSAVILTGVLCCNDDEIGLILLVTGGGVLALGGIVYISSCLVKAHRVNKQFYVQSSKLLQHEFRFKKGSSLTAGIDLLRDNKYHNATLGVGVNYKF